MRNSTLLIFAFAATQHVNAFWGISHVLLARHAQELLQEEAPDVYQAVLDELAPLKEDYPSLTTNEDKHPMTECATFADDIKANGFSWQNGWHFINTPYYDEGDNGYPFSVPDYDIVGALSALTDWLGHRDTDYESTHYYQQIISAFPDMDDARSFALRLVIHYVGDIHQPLHTVALVDSDYPYGDAGGNAEPIPNICGANNLHGVWDSITYLYCGYPNLPLSDADWSWYTAQADDITS